MQAILVSNIVEANGMTVKENNLLKEHGIAIGALVEVHGDSNDEESANGLRLFVVEHARDCDGTPLYSLSFKRNALQELKEAEKDQQKIKNSRNATATDASLALYCRGLAQGSILHGYPESCLKLIK